MRGILPNGPAITARRIHLGLTQEQLSDRSRLDVKTIRKAEKNGRIDLDTLTRVAFALDTPLADLIVDGVNPEDHLGLREVIIRWHRVWEAHDMEGLMSVFTDDAELTLPGAPYLPFAGVHRGKDALRHLHEVIWSGPPQQRFQIEEIEMLFSGENATLRGRRGIAMPSGELAYFPSVIISRFRGNLISHQEVQFDTLDFARRMGLME